MVGIISIQLVSEHQNIPKFLDAQMVFNDVVAGIYIDLILNIGCWETCER